LLVKVDADAKNSNRGRDPCGAVIVAYADVPVYMRIAKKAKHLRQLGMSDKAIARAFEVSDKTFAKALRSVAVVP
jgi:hypothetical protein